MPDDIEQTLHFPLTHGWAAISLPEKLTALDVVKLKALLEAVALGVDDAPDDDTRCCPVCDGSPCRCLDPIEEPHFEASQEPVI